MSSTYTIPYVTTRSGNTEKTVDIYSRLLDERIIYIGTPIDDGVAKAVIAQLLHLENDNADMPISLYLNSAGGSMSATLAIYDCMQFVHPTLETTCVGQVVSSSALLLAGGTHGHRLILPHGRVVLHAPVTEGGRGAIPDLIIEAEEIERIRSMQEEILAQHCGVSAEQVRKDTERKLVLTAQQAVDYGLADNIVAASRRPGS